MRGYEKLLGLLVLLCGDTKTISVVSVIVFDYFYRSHLLTWCLRLAAHRFGLIRLLFICFSSNSVFFNNWKWLNYLVTHNSAILSTIFNAFLLNMTYLNQKDNKQQIYASILWLSSFYLLDSNFGCYQRQFFICCMRYGYRRTPESDWSSFVISTIQLIMNVLSNYMIVMFSLTEYAR
jgi:hypothetical protein